MMEEVMPPEYLEIPQSFSSGRRSFVFLEKDHYIVADISFQRSGFEVNFIKKYGLSAPATLDNFTETAAEIVLRLKSLKKLNRHLIIALPPSFFSITLITLPKTKSSHINLFIKNKLKSPVEPLAFKYRVLREYRLNNVSKLSVSVCSTRRSIINELYTRFEIAGFRVKGIYHPYAGLVNLVQKHGIDSEEGLVLYVDTTLESPSISVFNGMNLENFRFPSQVQQPDLADYSTNLAIEIKRTFHFCKQQHAGKDVAHIIYSGEEDELFESVSEKISTLIGYSLKMVKLANTGEEADQESSDDPAGYIPALCGLFGMNNALSRFSMSRSNYNFSASHSQSKLAAKVYMVTMIVLALLVFHLDSTMSDKSSRLQSRLAGVNDGLSEFVNLEKRKSLFEAKSAYFENLREVLGEVDKENKGLSVPLLVAVDTVPETSRIVSINLSESRDSDTPTRMLLLRITDDFTGDGSYKLEKCVERFKKCGYFRKVKYNLGDSRSQSSSDGTLEEAILELEL